MKKVSHPRFRRWILRPLAGILAVILCLGALGAAFQAVGAARDRRAAPPPGELVSVDGHHMHIHCTGQGAPTAVLEAGATGFAQTWTWVQAELSKTTRVCSYDRAGMGWSEDWETGHDAVAIARNLEALLRAAGERGPYVLVGHSLGGSFAQAFVGLYPDAVAGLGLVDPSHPDQLDRFPPEIRAQQEDFHAMIGIAATLAHVGVLRATNLLGRSAKGLPEADYRTARMFAASPRHLRTSHDELAAWDETMAAARRVDTFGDRPAVVISATENMGDMPPGFLETNHALHAELAAMSSVGRHVRIPAADHFSLLMNATHARRTAALLAELIGEIRSGGQTIE